MSKLLIFVVLVMAAGLIYIAVRFINEKSNGLIAKMKVRLDELLVREIRDRLPESSQFAVIHLKDVCMSNDSGPDFVSRTALLKTPNGRFALAILHSNEDCLYLEEINELRARRALFNNPKEYLAAFGESPDRKQLARLMGNEAKIEL